MGHTSNAKLLLRSSRNYINKFSLSWTIFPASGKHNCDFTSTFCIFQQVDGND